MKKRIAILITSLIILVCSAVAFSACDTGQRYSNTEVVDRIALCSNKLYKKSLAKYCEWDGDMNSMEFTVPDEYNGYKVKCLGAKGNPGFTGNPGSFGVRLPNKIGGYESIVKCMYEPGDANPENTTDLNFTVYIGKFVDELEQIENGGLYGYGVNDIGGVGDKVEHYYRVKITYVINSDNSAFYSQDGDIYYKSNNKKVQYRG
ncbi:MAG: hypothetical protein NC033_06475 [Clostridiales bacterium]|nr:hypothetical protein [Clostridiales bacterium]